MNQGTVVALFRQASKTEQEVAEALSIVAGKGIKGDLHFGWDTRQVLFISTEELGMFGYEPGDWREQITLNFSGLQDLKPGTRLTVGNVPFEVEQDCAPCSSLAKRLGEEPKEFVRKTLRRRGMFLKPLGDGEVRIGDPVVVIDA